MKIFKSYRALCLWTLLFGAVACSTQSNYNDKFLENVRGKTLTDNNGGDAWRFSADGREINRGNEHPAFFLEAVSDIRGIYKTQDSEVKAMDLFLGIEYKGKSSRMYLDANKNSVWSSSISTDITIQ